MLIVYELNSLPCATYYNYMLEYLKSKPVIGNLFRKKLNVSDILSLYNKEGIFY